MATTASASAVDGDLESTADLAHAGIGQPSESRDEHGDPDALDGVEVDCCSARDRVVAGLEDDFAGKRSNRCRARCDKCSSKSRDRRVARQDDDGAPADLGKLAPPQLSPRRQRAHEAAAACRNEARSPHSSGSSSGSSS